MIPMIHRLLLPTLLLASATACATAPQSAAGPPADGAPLTVEVVNTTLIELELHTRRGGSYSFFDTIRAGEVRRVTLPPGVTALQCRAPRDPREAVGCRVRVLPPGAS
jgi:hypothetical protein